MIKWAKLSIHRKVTFTPGLATRVLIIQNVRANFLVQISIAFIVIFFPRNPNPVDKIVCYVNLAEEIFNDQALKISYYFITALLLLLMRPL